MGKNQSENDYYMQADQPMDDGSMYQAEVEGKGSVLAVSSSKSALMMVGIVLMSVFFIYYIFFAEEEGVVEEEVQRLPPQIDENQAVEVADDTGGIDSQIIPVIPDLPEPPELVVPTPPPPPEPVAEETAPPPLETSTDSIAPPDLGFGSKKKKGVSEERRKSGILVSGAGGGKGIAEEGKELLAGDKKAYRGDDFVLEITEADQEYATTVGDSSRTIVQGKMIDAILETAINTDLPGVLRSLVSHDIYAETGKSILIPKGSRLVGEYKAEVKRGQTRVLVTWNRIIRPDGVDVKIDSPGVDQLGRSGVDGKVNNRYLEIFGNSVLLSTITTASAIAIEGITDSQGISIRENSSGNDTESGKPSDFAIRDAVDNFSEIAKELLGETVETQPTITVDQGTRIKVFVNRDLVFPKSIANRIRMVQ